jgi:hypothetical protein
MCLHIINPSQIKMLQTNSLYELIDITNFIRRQKILVMTVPLAKKQ